MAGTFSNRKVARAARAGGSSRRIRSRSYGFTTLCLAICAVGTATVWFSYDQRNGTTNYGNTAPLAPIPAKTEGAAPVRNGDHWFEAVGFYTCGTFAPNISVTTNPYGISTNNDGVIHIAPFQRKYAGHNSTLGLFAKAVGLKLDRSSFQLPGDKTDYKPGTDCSGKGGQFVIKEWTNASDNNSGKVVKSDPTALLLEDNHALTVAWVPEGTDPKTIPLPPSASTLAAVKASSAGTSTPGATATTAPSGTPTSAPVATATTAAAPAAPAPAATNTTAAK